MSEGTDLNLSKAKELCDQVWHDAVIVGVEDGIRNGKRVVTICFDVQGKKLVKDFWLTEKGVFVFRVFLRQLQVKFDLHGCLDLVSLKGKRIEILIEVQRWYGRKWLEILKCRLP